MTTPRLIVALGDTHPVDAPLTAPDGVVVYEPGPPAMVFVFREADGERCEAVFNDFPAQQYSLALTLQYPGPTPRDMMTLWQVHPSRTPDTDAGGWGGPLLVMRIGPTELSAHVRWAQGKESTQQIWTGPNDMAPHRWSADVVQGAPGSVLLRRDGVLIADYVGPIGYPADTGLPYFRCGLYSWEQTWDTFVPERRVLISNVVLS